MAKSKTKESKKVVAAEPAVKSAGVTKPSQTPKSKSKDVAKAVKKAGKDKEEKKSKKKAPEPESESSESESESESEDSASSDSSDSESEKDTKKKAATNGKAKAKAAESSSESESDSDAESDAESDSDSSESESDAKAKTNGAAKTNGKAKAAAKADESSDSSDSSDSDSDSEESEEKPAEAESKDSTEDSDDSDDSSDSDASESEEAEAPAPASKKRKAEEEISEAPKRGKTDNPNAASTLFAGSLSWNVDDDALYEAFKDFEGLTSARVVSDRQTGRSKGFGYVDFADTESATKAFEAMNGQMIDNRAINLDYAAPRGDANPQNRAADRAKKHGDSVSPESDTLFVGNLPFDVDQDIVRGFFTEVREVTSVRLPTDPESGSLKGFGYVSFGSVEDAKAAFEQLNGASIGNGRNTRSVRLDFASQRPPQDGGRGGGRGGFGGGRGGGRGRGGFGGRGGGRGGPRGGFGGGRGGGAGFSGTKISFD